MSSGRDHDFNRLLTEVVSGEDIRAIAEVPTEFMSVHQEVVPTIKGDIEGAVCGALSSRRAGFSDATAWKNYLAGLMALGEMEICGERAAHQHVDLWAIWPGGRLVKALVQMLPPVARKQREAMRLRSETSLMNHVRRRVMNAIAHQIHELDGEYS